MPEARPAANLKPCGNADILCSTNDRTKLAEMIRDGLAEEGFEIQVRSNSRTGWDVAISSDKDTEDAQSRAEAIAVELRQMTWRSDLGDSHSAPVILIGANHYTLDFSEPRGSPRAALGVRNSRAPGPQGGASPFCFSHRPAASIVGGS
jgi:hypothetical protein